MATTPYIQHLIALPSEHQVYANARLTTRNGELICESGLRMAVHQLEALDKAQLALPPFAVTSIDNTLTAEQLYQDFLHYLQSNARLKQLSQTHLNHGVLKTCCTLACRYPVIKQHLTVMRSQLSDTYQQSLFCAWLSTVVMQHIKKQGAEIGSMFIAGLCHDIGMLHINPATLNSTGELTVEQWLEIKTHPQRGHRLLAQIPKLPTSIAQTALDHHELPDGSGYPNGKLANSIHEYAHFIRLLDSLFAIARKHPDCNLGDVTPMLEVSLNVKNDAVGRALIELLSPLKSPQPLVPIELMPYFTEVVKSELAHTLTCTQILHKCLLSFGFKHQHKGLHALQNGMFHIVSAIDRSSMINSAYVRFLEQTAQQQLSHYYTEIERAFIMNKEVLFQLNKLRQNLWQLVTKEHGDLSLELTDCLMALEDVPEPATARELNDLWVMSL